MGLPRPRAVLVRVAGTPPARRVRRVVRGRVAAARRRARELIGPVARRVGLTPVQWRPDPGIRAGLLTVRWLDGGVLELNGWAYADGPDTAGPDAHETTTAITLVCEGRGGPGPISLDVSSAPSTEVNLFTGDARTDRSRAGFRATVDLSRLADRLRSSTGEWTLTARVSVLRSGRAIGTTTMTELQRHGSAEFGRAVDVGSGLVVRPRWRPPDGLTVQLARRAVSLERPVLAGTCLEFGLALRHFSPTRIVVRDGDGEESEVPRLEGGSGPTFRLDLATLVDRVGPFYLHAVDAVGRSRFVHWTGSPDADAWITDSLPTLRVVATENGVIRIDRAEVWLTVSGACVDDTTRPVLVVTGDQRGLRDGARLELVGPRQTLTTNSTTDGTTGGAAGGTTFRAEFDLAVIGPFGSTPTAPRVGSYVLHAVNDSGDRLAVALTAPSLAEQMPVRRVTRTAEVRLERSATGRFRVRFGPPHPGAERSRHAQRGFRSTYRRRGHQVTESVYLECFDGRSCGDNPAAIDAELARRRPDLTRFWSVADYSVEVPAGAVPLLRHSERWWAELARARYLVTNCWLVNGAVRRNDQTVLQTWHGTPYKRLGLDRLTGTPGSIDRLRYSTSVWDLMISQNPFSTQRFRSAYLFANESLEIGYPRNDILVNGIADLRRDQIRRWLGIAEGQRVLAYLPTWRDENRTLDVGLDPGRLLDRLGPGWTLVLRGHSYTHRLDRHRRAADGTASVVDATLYPDPAELFSIADVLVTDYSSVMFDYSLTGKPMIFLTPDLEEYATQTRGAYFDLESRGPGPCVPTTDDVADCVQNLADVVRRYADRYAAWRAEFNPWDDGAAAGRAVDALLAHDPAASR